MNCTKVFSPCPVRENSHQKISYQIINVALHNSGLHEQFEMLCLRPKKIGLHLSSRKSREKFMKRLSTSPPAIRAGINFLLKSKSRSTTSSVLRKILLSTLFLSLISASLYSQSVDPLTGSVNVNIPIWTISSGDLSYPIRLSYSGNGVKVNDTEQSAGMNWSISSGGGVYREVKGLPDDFVGAVSGVINDTRNGWLHGSTGRQVDGFVPAADQNFGVCSDEIADWNKLNGFGYTIDTEPDVFVISAPGLSGRFLFDKNKQVVTAPFQDLKIQYARGSDSLIYQFIITDNAGVKYTFQNGDQTTRTVSKKDPLATINYFTTNFNYYQNPATYYYAWHLTQIDSPRGGQLIFSYQLSQGVRQSTDFARIVNPTTNVVDTLYFDNQNITSYDLQAVSGANETCTYFWSGDLISQIVVSEKSYQTTVRNFIFKYDYVAGTYKTYKRAFLSQLQQQFDCSAFPSHKFTYYGISNSSIALPFNSSLGQDIYGYYNATATSEVPEVYMPSGDTGQDGERYRIAPASGYSLVATGGGRSVNTAVIASGSLQSIVTLTGATTTVVYEPANYYDAATNSTITGGGVRVKSVTASSGSDPSSDITSTYSYKRSKSSSQSSGQWTYRPVFAFSDGTNVIRVPDNLAPEETLLYSRVEVATSGQGRIVYEFQNSGTYNQTSSGDFNATLSRLARPDPGAGACASLGSLRSGYYTFPFVENTNYDFERGLPLAVSAYTGDRKKIVSKKIYSYQRTSMPVSQVSGVRFEKFNSVFQYGKYTLLGNVNKMTQIETSRTYDQSDTTLYIESSKSYTYNGNAMLSQVTTTNSDNTSYSNTYKYAKDYASTGTDLQSQMINALVTNNQHGTLIESVSSSGGNVMNAQLTLFNNNYGSSRVLPMQQLALGDPAGFTPSTVSGSAFSYSGNYYPVSFMDAYDVLGTPTMVRDQARKTSSLIMGYKNSLPAVEVSNARTDQVAYSDFEPFLSSSMTYTATVNTSDSWSGKNSLSLTSTTNATQSVTRAASNYYRFSCWAKASATTNLTVSVNSAQTSISYPSTGTVGQWQYMEKRIDVSSISTNASFTFQLTASGNIQVDNVAFYPENSDIAMHAYDPRYGKTGDLDSRGNAAFQEFDVFGRVHYVRNQDKDIVAVKDYHYTTEIAPAIESGFTYGSQAISGVPVTFTGASNCVAGVTYSWFVDDVNQNISTSVFTYTFNDNRDYRVRFVVSANGLSSATELVMHPAVHTTAAIHLSFGDVISQDCSSMTRNVTPSVIITGCYEPGNTTYDWFLKVGAGGRQHLGTTTSSTYGPIAMTTGINYEVTCTVNTTCFNQTTNVHESLLTLLDSSGNTPKAIYNFGFQSTCD